MKYKWGAGVGFHVILAGSWETAIKQLYTIFCKHLPADVYLNILAAAVGGPPMAI